jgi:hypothetical protein
MDYSLDEVLAWLNAERKRLGFESSLETIPKGYMYNGMFACSCPVALALSPSDTPSAMNAIVDGDSYWPAVETLINDKTAHPLPDYVRMFITDWDAGHYPELVVS